MLIPKDKLHQDAKAGRTKVSMAHDTNQNTNLCYPPTGVLQEDLSSGAKQGCKLHKKLEAICWLAHAIHHQKDIMGYNNTTIDAFGRALFRYSIG